MAVSADILERIAGPRPLAEFDPADVDRVALKAFFAIAGEWQLSRDQAMTLLGSPSERTFYRWRAGKVSSLPKDTLERISVLLGIYKAIHILLPEADRANEYVHRPNAAFGGDSALSVMLRGRVEHLYRVRRHLDAWRG
ncbi:MAG: MbcA/ParS/Xre antitoxin family protein [Woeseiaceae bacterium]|nr:MbcA/ParS/Xre antitoxin family protein [Woeseiaceae bacterium]